MGFRFSHELKRTSPISATGANIGVKQDLSGRIGLRQAVHYRPCFLDTAEVGQHRGSVGLCASCWIKCVLFLKLLKRIFGSILAQEE